MLSDLEKANMALLHLGISKSIGSFTENSNEARALNTFYDTTNEWLLRNYKWPFATGFVNLALVETNPTDEWAYSYRYPTDCLFFRRVLNGIPSGFLNDSEAFLAHLCLTATSLMLKFRIKLAVTQKVSLSIVILTRLKLSILVSPTTPCMRLITT